MQTIIAAFDDQATAQDAVDQLMEQGMSRDNIHLESGYQTKEKTGERRDSSDDGFFGGVKDFFSNLFGDDSDAEDSDKYSEAVRRGSAVVAVDAQTDEQAEKARSVLDRCGAFDIDKRADQWKSKGWTGFDARSKPLSDDELKAERGTTMPVIEEELEVGKRSVQGGGVRVVKRVTDTPVSEMVKLRQERATVERTPVDRAATKADMANFKEGSVEVRERSEQAVVGKTARVVEEVKVGKEVTEESKTVSGTVRKTDVDVERVPKTSPQESRKA